MYTYTINLYTGSLSWAGTNANVSITLYGTEGESKEPHIFNNDLTTTFKSGSKDTFKIDTEESLGTLQKVRVGHDNTGHLPGWKLLKMEVLDDTTGEGIEFDCYKWFDLESGDGKIQRDLYPTGEFRAKTYMYKIFFHTGDEWFAGTDANVSITLYGTNGDSGNIELENEGPTTFETGMMNVYNIERKSPLGTLTKVRVGHDDTGVAPGWFLDKIRVEDTVNDQIVTFPCSLWLASDSDDGMIERELIGDDFEKRDEEAKRREKEQQEEEERKRREEEEKRMKEEEDRKRREQEQLEKFQNEKKKKEEERQRRREENRLKIEAREKRRSREILCDIDETEKERIRREAEERKRREEELKRKEKEILKKEHERQLKRQAALEEFQNRKQQEDEKKKEDEKEKRRKEEEERKKKENEEPKQEVETLRNIKNQQDDVIRKEEEEKKKIEEEEERKRREERKKEELRRKNEQQEKRRSLLLEEKERRMRTYKVNLFTEDAFGAWTGANILLTLYGSEGQSDEHCINSEGPHTFGDGMRGCLDIVCPHHLDTLTHIRIGPDHTGWASPWFLVTVEDPKTENVVVFTCNRLLDTEKLHSPHIYYPSNTNDVDELLALESDTSETWKKVKKTRKAQIWRKKAAELKEIPSITKAELHLRGIPYQAAVKYFTDWQIRRQWDKTFSVVDILETIGNFKVIYCSNKMPTFCKNREMVLACLDHHDQRYHTQIMCSIFHPSVPQDPNTEQIRASTNLFGIVVRPVDDGTESSKVTVITQVDLKGSAPKFVKNGYLANNPVKWIKMMKRYHKKHPHEDKNSATGITNGEKPNSNNNSC